MRRKTPESGKKKEPRKVYILAGGGTAGHINPALAVAEAMKRKSPDAEILFFTTSDGIEDSMVREAGYPALRVFAGSLPTRLYQWPAFIAVTVAGVIRAMIHLKKHRPKAVLGTGGYVITPLAIAAHILRIPLYLHEQNAIPGRANRLFSSLSRGIFLTFSESQDYFPPSKIAFYLSGNPISLRFRETDQQRSRQKLGLPEDETLVLILGGSLGSKAINQAVQAFPETPGWEKIKKEIPDLHIVLSGGRVNKRFIDREGSQLDSIDIYEYIDTAEWMPAADLLVGRSGAGFLMETAACGKPSLLIPFPAARDDHQRLNAEVFEASGAARILPEEEMNPERLIEEISELISDRGLWEAMGKAASRLARPEAADMIAEELLKDRRK